MVSPGSGAEPSTPDHVVAVARFDLVRLARDLRDQGRHPDLVDAVEQAAAIGSIRDDLRTALASLDHIVRLQEAAEAEGRVEVRDGDTVVTGALFVQAIILYFRATESSASRDKLLGRSGLSRDERETHSLARDLRNKCIAHFGHGDAFSDGPLFKEAVLFNLLLVGGRPKKQVSVLSTRAQHKVAFSARLGGLLRTRLAQIPALSGQLFDAVDRAFETATNEDKALRENMDQYLFDVDGFAASSEAAAKLRAQLESGDVIDMDYAVMVPKP